MAHRRDRTPPPRGLLSLAYALTAVVAAQGAGLPSDAAGQEVPSPYEFFDHRYEGSLGLLHWETQTGQFDLGPRSGTGAVARFGYHIDGPFSVEAVGALTPTNRAVVEPRPPENGGPQAVGEADVLLLSGEARLRFHVTGDRTWYGLAPYASAGLGLADDVREQRHPDLEDGQRFSFGPSVTGYVGVGSQWYVGDRFLVQSDVGVTAWRMSNPPGFQELTGQGDLGTVDENEWALNPGITLTLGVRR